MSDTVLVDQAGAVATLTLNRPDKGNAFDQPTLDALGAAFDTLGRDAQVRVVVLRGAGKHFCTGADVGARREPIASDVTFGEALARLSRLLKPTIAVTQGGCVGGGLGFAACCDAIIARDDSFFAIPELRVGIAPSETLCGLLIRAMGERPFRRYALSGERFSAQVALRIGLAQEIGSAEEVEARLAAMIDGFLDGAPQATSVLKKRIARLAFPGDETVFPKIPVPHERTAEQAEGVAAFKEKRKPAWRAAAAD